MSRDFTDESAGSSEKQRDIKLITKYVCLYFWIKLTVEKHFSNHRRLQFSKKSQRILRCSNWKGGGDNNEKHLVS